MPECGEFFRLVIVRKSLRDGFVRGVLNKIRITIVDNDSKLVVFFKSWLLLNDMYIWLTIIPFLLDLFLLVRCS